MTSERKAPKDWGNWADFANCYNIVLFNEAPNLVHRDNKSYDEGVLNEWLEQHDCTKEDKEDDCTCEPCQWYAIAISEYDQKYLNDTFNMDIFYSEVLQLYILPVYHYGTAWSHVPLSMNNTTDND